MLPVAQKQRKKGKFFHDSCKQFFLDLSIILSLLFACVMTGIIKLLWADLILESIQVPAASPELSLGSLVFYKKCLFVPFTP